MQPHEDQFFLQNTVSGEKLLIKAYSIVNEGVNFYKDNVDDLTNVDYKAIVAECMKPIDTFFGRFGNSIISLCDGIVNAGSESAVIRALSNDLKEVVDKVKEVGSAEMNAKLTNQLNRLAELGNEINASEGIVFKYGDRLMKSTGSFAAVNQILGMRFQM